MKATSFKRTRFAGTFGLIVLFAAGGAGCTDVGDDSSADSADSSTDGAIDGTASGSDGSQSLEASTDAPAAPSPEAGSAADDSGGNEQPDTGSSVSPDAGGPAQDATVQEAGNGEPEASAPDTGAGNGEPDATIAEGGATTPDAGSSVPDAGTSTPEAGTLEAGGPAPDAGGSPPDAGGTGGGLAPCMAAGQTGCVTCPNVSTGICTPTEAAFVQLDITAGIITAAGPAPGGSDDPTASCYACLISGSCLDSSHIHTFECGDFAGNFTNGAGASVVGSTACLATLECEIGPSSNQCLTSANGITSCYCGSQGGAPTACATAGANVNGPCASQNIAGLKYVATDSNDIVINFSDNSQPSGLANSIVSCAAANSCTHCGVLGTP